MKRTRILWLAGLLTLVTFAPSVYPQRQPSEQQLLSDLIRDVLNLHAAVNTLQKSVDTKNDAMLKQMEQMTAQTSQMTERFGPLNASIQKLNEGLAGIRTDSTTSVQDLRKLLESVRTDVGGLNEKVKGLDLQVRSFSETVNAARASETPLPSAAALFAQASSDFSANVYPAAISGFKDFLAAHPKDIRADSAQFYVGRSYVALQQPQMAIDAFDELLQKYPGSSRTCGALWEKGRILAGQKKNPEAKATLAQVVRDCPAGTAEVTNAAAALKTLPAK